MIRVWHNREFMKYASRNYTVKSQERRLIEGCLCQLAGTVDTSNLSEAYRLTNNIDCPWTDNKGVKATGLSKRSTSVGDILEVDGGPTVIVETLGYRELSPEEKALITWHTVPQAS